METEEVIVCTRVPAQWAKWLDELAAVSDVSRSKIIRKAIEEQILRNGSLLGVEASDPKVIESNRQGEM